MACLALHQAVAEDLADDRPPAFPPRPEIYHDGWNDLNKNGVKDPYEDPQVDVDSRIEDLLGRMTLDEKTAQMVTLYGFPRVLTDELTLPVIPLALLYAVSGRNPLVDGALLLAVLAAVLIPAILYLPSIPFGAGAFGMGDVKFLVGMGLMVGGERALSGTLFGLIAAGVVLLLLLATRRIGRRSYIPFGPFLIIGALWAVLIRV